MIITERRRLLTALTALVPLSFARPAAAAETQVVLETSKGDITITLEAGRAPATVKNFLAYARDGFYDGTIFHRVIDGFMIQGGGFGPDMKQKATLAPVVNEARGGLPNRRGTVAMARTADPHSATAQFFINVADNAFLNSDRSRDGWGYTVFGRVSAGMAVVDEIARVKTGPGPRGMTDVPREPVLIKSVRVINP